MFSQVVSDENCCIKRKADRNFRLEDQADIKYQTPRPPINLSITKRDNQKQSLPMRYNQNTIRYSEISLRYFYQKSNPNQASSSICLQKIQGIGKFKLVKCHHGDTISKLKHRRNFTEQMVWRLHFKKLASETKRRKEKLL